MVAYKASSASNGDRVVLRRKRSFRVGRQIRGN